MIRRRWTLQRAGWISIRISSIGVIQRWENYVPVLALFQFRDDLVESDNVQ